MMDRVPDDRVPDRMIDRVPDRMIDRVPDILIDRMPIDRGCPTE